MSFRKRRKEIFHYCPDTRAHDDILFDIHHALLPDVILHLPPTSPVHCLLMSLPPLFLSLSFSSFPFLSLPFPSSLTSHLPHPHSLTHTPSLSPGGLIPLHNACSFGHTEVVSILLKHGTDPNARDNWNFTPLHEAAIKGKVDVCISKGLIFFQQCVQLCVQTMLLIQSFNDLSHI